MSSCQSEIVAETADGYISWCRGCQEFTFAYKNLVLNFTDEHLVEFHDWLNVNLDNPDYIYPLPHGKDHVYPSPVDNLRIAFTHREIDELSHLMVQARLVMDARRLVRAN